ncbi:MAG: hypothetical protein J7639_21520 [Paenibacillaceae bacterium]|nr:hypothetical protein [Paenibacillaceae bacterium]
MTRTGNATHRITLLAIDDQSLPYRRQAGLHLGKPAVRPEPVLAASPWGSGAPDDSAAHFYGTVLQDEGKFRMWYYACHWGINPDWPPHKLQQVARKPSWFLDEEMPLIQGPLCYAESEDGIAWTKPALGQVLFKGSRDNNALELPHTIVSGAIVIRDDDDPDPARRYKMTYQFFPDQSVPPMDENGTVTSVALAVSPDGIRWTTTGIPFRNQFVEPSSFIKHNSQYIIHYQTGKREFGEGGTACGRNGRARVTADFDAWPDLYADTFALPEPEDRSLRGLGGSYDQVHLGVGAASFGNVCVGLYGLWHSANFGPGFGDISCDLGLLVSNDGIKFREPVKGHRFIRREDSPPTPVPGYSFNTILAQANGILNVGDETRIYHGRWRNVGGFTNNDAFKHYYAEVGLATLPRDRWGSFAIDPDAEDGAVVSAPIVLPADAAHLALNADGAAGIAVSLLDERQRPIAGFEEGRAAGDGLESRIVWPDRELAELAGRTVVLQIAMRRRPDAGEPRVYALYID